MLDSKLDLKEIEKLSPEEKKAVFDILNELAKDGKSDLLDKFKYADYDEIPVDIHTFLHDKRYLGGGLYDQEGRFTLFPYWEKKLEEIFPDNLTTRYNTIILTGAIGLGKTLLAVICLLYLLYRLLCLKNPYTHYGMQEIDKISIGLVNFTLENAKGVALDKMNQLILASPWFLSHGTMAGETNLIYRPEKHIEFCLASSNNQIIGRALIASFEDEVNFSTTSNPEKIKQKMKTLIAQVDARMKSRYMRTKEDGTTYLPTLNIIASSKASDQSFLDEYINTKKEHESSTTLIVDEPQWVVDIRKDNPIKFYISIGDKFKPNELLPLDITQEQLSVLRSKGHNIMAIPIGYLSDFQDNIDEAICSIAGIATASSLKYIAGDRVNATKTNKYMNPFTKDVIEVGNAPNDYLQYANFFDLNRVSKEDLAKPLFIHLDMSMSGDKTGIAGVWIMGKQASTKTIKALNNKDDISELGDEDTGIVDNKENEDSEIMDLRYKLAFSVSVKAPKQCQVSFEKNRNFIRWLRDKGFAIKGVSSDTFQSATIQQELKSDGFNTSILSVDRVDKASNTCIPYHYLKSAIYERRVEMYEKCDLLTEELIGLERKEDGHIDHTTAGINSKDQSDAFCGALFLASKYAEEYSYNYGDNVVAGLDATMDGDPKDRKKQMMADFEAELAKIYKENDEAVKKERQKENEEIRNARDIADGILNF